MPTSSTRKVSFAALGLMLAALGVDRFILGSGATGPQAASASLPVSSDPLPMVPITGEASSSGSMPQTALAIRLDGFRESLAANDAHSLDVFHASSDWLLPPAEPTVAKDVAPVVDQTTDFASKHRITSVMLGGKAAMVVIDGTCVKQGEQFGGMVLAKVEQGAAVFEYGGKSVRLTVEAVSNQTVQSASK